MGGSASDFGMDSMFESAKYVDPVLPQLWLTMASRSRHRHRQALADEDAPPTTSINDIVNEVYTDAGPRQTTRVSHCPSMLARLYIWS